MARLILLLVVTVCAATFALEPENPSERGLFDSFYRSVRPQRYESIFQMLMQTTPRPTTKRAPVPTTHAITHVTTHATTHATTTTMATTTTELPTTTTEATTTTELLSTTPEVVSTTIAASTTEVLETSAATQFAEASAATDAAETSTATEAAETSAGTDASETSAAPTTESLPSTAAPSPASGSDTKSADTPADPLETLRDEIAKALASASSEAANYQGATDSDPQTNALLALFQDMVAAYQQML